MKKINEGHKKYFDQGNMPCRFGCDVLSHQKSGQDFHIWNQTLYQEANITPIIRWQSLSVETLKTDVAPANLNSLLHLGL